MAQSKFYIVFANNRKESINSNVQIISRFLMLSDMVPYSQLALYYDRVMNHVDYKKWAKFIKTILSHYYQTPKNIVELACGTGAIFKYLKSKKLTGKLK